MYKPNDKKNIDSVLKSIIEKRERIPHLESWIAKFPNYAVLYAKTVLRDRFLDAEQYIASSPYYVCAYISELELKEVPVNMHRIMLSSAIKTNLPDDDKNYWLKQYFKFCDYLEGKESKPWWLSKDKLNWNYVRSHSNLNS